MNDHTDTRCDQLKWDDSHAQWTCMIDGYPCMVAGEDTKVIAATCPQVLPTNLPCPSCSKAHACAGPGLLLDARHAEETLLCPACLYQANAGQCAEDLLSATSASASDAAKEPVVPADQEA